MCHGPTLSLLPQLRQLWSGSDGLSAGAYSSLALIKLRDLCARFSVSSLSNNVLVGARRWRPASLCSRLCFRWVMWALSELLPAAWSSFVTLSFFSSGTGLMFFISTRARQHSQLRCLSHARNWLLLRVSGYRQLITLGVECSALLSTSKSSASWLQERN